MEGNQGNIVVNEISCMGALAYLQSLPSESVDCIVTDPPYNIRYHSNESANPEYRAIYEESKKWDSDFDFSPFFPEMLRVLKEGKQMYVFSRFDTFVDYMRKGLPVPDAVLIWDKHNFGMGNLEWFVPDYELILVWAKGGAKLRKGIKRPGSIIRIRRISNDIRLHPTQKPTNIIGRLLSFSTDEGDLVLDPFMGSGTVAVAALQMKRNFIGCDQNQEYVVKSRERIAQFKTYLERNE